MYQLNWYWIAIASFVPPIFAGLVAYPFWRRDQAIFGNIFGTVILFSTAFGMIMREKMALDALMQECLDSGQQVCIPEPAPFTRFAVFAFIALVQVILLFMYSLRVDEKARRRGYAPEWR
jgi:hypothetical protein